MLFNQLNLNLTLQLKLCKDILTLSILFIYFEVIIKFICFIG
jgi:hypothetical protein